MKNPELEEAIRTYYRCGFGGRIAPRREEYYVDSSLNPVYAEAKLKRVLRYKTLQAGDRILEVGCGFGSFVLTCELPCLRDRLSRGAAHPSSSAY